MKFTIAIFAAICILAIFSVEVDARQRGSSGRRNIGGSNSNRGRANSKPTSHVNRKPEKAKFNPAVLDAAIKIIDGLQNNQQVPEVQDQDPVLSTA